MNENPGTVKPSMDQAAPFNVNAAPAASVSKASELRARGILAARSGLPPTLAALIVQGANEQRLQALIADPSPASVAAWIYQEQVAQKLISEAK